MKLIVALLPAILLITSCETPCKDLTEEKLLKRQDCAQQLPLYPNNEGYSEGRNRTIYNNNFYYPTPGLPLVPAPAPNSSNPTRVYQTYKLRRQTTVEQQKPTQTTSPTQNNEQKVAPSTKVGFTKNNGSKAPSFRTAL